MKGKNPYKENTCGNNPAPGHYDNIKTKPKGLSMTFKGKSEPVRDTPGAGAYDTDKYENTFRKAPSYSMGIRDGKSGGIENLAVRENPGPGAYSPTPGYNKQLAKSFSGILRPQDASDNGPGPSNYTPNARALSTSASSPAFSFAGKSPIPDTVVSPGAGAYTMTCYNKKKGPSYSLNGRRKSNSHKSTPAPGAYDVSVSLTKKRSPGFSMGARFDKVQSIVSKETPAPYSLNLNATHRRASAYSMASRPKTAPSNFVPGPGTHDPFAFQQLGSNGPAFTMRQRYETFAVRGKAGSGKIKPKSPYLAKTRLITNKRTPQTLKKKSIPKTVKKQQQVNAVA